MDENVEATGLSGALAELAGLLLDAESVDDLTQQIAQLATRTVPGAATCAITMSVAGRTLTVASADALGRLLDEQQYDIDEGPCLQAIRTEQIVAVDDLATETRWDGYPARALAHGIAAVYSTPLMVRGQCLGALNLYARSPHPFTGDAKTIIAAFTNLTAAGIAGALRGAQDVTLTDQLRAALTSREVIDQAIGIIIGQQHCTPRQAFAVLRTISQTRNIRLSQVAMDLVEGTITHEPPDS
jgi:GAF domain-containing protein